MQYENIPEVLNNVISSLINGLLTSVDNNVFSILDELVFVNTSILKGKYFMSIFTNSFSIVSLSKALLFGVLIYYAISYLFSHLVCKNFQKPFHFLTKLFFSALLIHFSSSICEYIIWFFDLLTNILRDLGVFLFSFNLSFTLIHQRINALFQTLPADSLSFFSFDGVLKSFISFGFINLLFTYSVRFIFIKILILMSPLAFLSIALDQSKSIFKIWLKNFIGQLCSQLFICIILLIMFSFHNTFDSTVTKLLYVASLVCLIKASSFVKDFTSGFTSDITTGVNNIKNNLL